MIWTIRTDSEMGSPAWESSFFIPVGGEVSADGAGVGERVCTLGEQGNGQLSGRGHADGAGVWPPAAGREWRGAAGGRRDAERGAAGGTGADRGAGPRADAEITGRGRSIGAPLFGKEEDDDRRISV